MSCALELRALDGEAGLRRDDAQAGCERRRHDARVVRRPVDDARDWSTSCVDVAAARAPPAAGSSRASGCPPTSRRKRCARPPLREAWTAASDHLRDRPRAGRRVAGRTVKRCGAVDDGDRAPEPLGQAVGEQLLRLRRVQAADVDARDLRRRPRSRRRGWSPRSTRRRRRPSARRRRRRGRLRQRPQATMHRSARCTPLARRSAIPRYARGRCGRSSSTAAGSSASPAGGASSTSPGTSRARRSSTSTRISPTSRCRTRAAIRCPRRSAFAAAASRAGIGPGVLVVAYGSLGGAERLWWLLRHFGHDDCARAPRRARRWGGPLRAGRGGDRAGGVRAAASASATRSRPTSSRGGSADPRSCSSTRARRTAGAASRTRSTTRRAGSPAR